MDMLLTTVTGLSLAMALAMAALVLRLLLAERRRSRARVAALIGMASDPAPAEHATASARPVPAVPHALDAFPAGAGQAGMPRAPQVIRQAAAPRRPVHSARQTPREIDLELRPAASAPAAGGAGGMFTEPVRRSAWGARLAVAAGLGALIVGAGFELSTRSQPVAAPVEQGTDVTTARAMLELLALGHTQEDARLSVTGLVQNARDGAPLTRVVATAFAFGPDGALLASGRAPLDFTSLAPGAESPFVVHIPLSGAVARYRIGFRAEDGDVIAHIDRRAAAAAVARK